ncbi:MAG: hypothetical protein LBH63_00385 [Clostridiales Family XIII bacterium]|jgi:hypothetical protein|nr:hypothetical protein [Clostridiales Family XIII bacterium]
MEEGYLYRKNRISAIVLVTFFVILTVLCSGLGYYWNALQGLLADITYEGDAGNVVGTIVVLVLVFVPVVVFAFFGSPRGYNRNIRFLLIAPGLIYAISAVLELRKIFPVAEKFKDVYTALDNAIYVPFVIAHLCLAVYYCLVLFLPASFATKGFGIFTMIVSIALYTACGVYIAYLQAMDVLNGSFGTGHFILYLVCFGLDAATYFLMLSVLMTYCLMCRELRTPRVAALDGDDAPRGKDRGDRR